MRSTWIAGLFALVLTLSVSSEAEAFNNCNEACAYIAYAIVTAGGVVSAAGSQISILQGEPDEGWGTMSLAFAGANAGVAGVLLIVGGVAAALDDDEVAVGFAMWGGIQMSIAIAGLVSGAHVIANDEAPPGGQLKPVPSGATMTFRF